MRITHSLIWESLPRVTLSRILYQIEKPAMLDRLRIRRSRMFGGRVEERGEIFAASGEWPGHLERQVVTVGSDPASPRGARREYEIIVALCEC